MKSLSRITVARSDELDADLGGSFFRDIGVAGEDTSEADASADAASLAGDVAKPDGPQRSPEKANAPFIELVLPRSVSNPLVVDAQVFGHREHEGDRRFGYGTLRTLRRQRHEYIGSCTRFHIDPVEANAVARDAN